MKSFLFSKKEKMISISSQEICIGWLFINQHIDLSNILRILLQSEKNKEIGKMIQKILSKELNEINCLLSLKSLTILLFSIIKKKIMILKYINKWSIHQNKEINDLLKKIQDWINTKSNIFVYYLKDV